MADFTRFLSKRSGEAKRPPLLPAGDYPGVIKKFEIDDDNRNNTPYVRYFLGFTDFPAELAQTWTQFDKATGKQVEVSRSDIDLSKRQMRRDFYLTDDALWRLDELLRSCGIPLGGEYEEVVAAAVGANVMIEVQQGLNEKTDEVFNQVGKLVGLK